MCLSNIADRARATLTAATTTVSVGDRVTLICSVEKSAGWKYEWFRRTSHTSEDTINDGLNGNIRVSQGGIYRCRGFRGEPAVYSDPSDEVTIQITFSNKVSVTQKPSWSQIFRGERITLTCEVQGGEGVQWEYEWRTPQSQTFRTKQKDWTITASISGDYSCKSRPTDDSYSATKWSEALRLSVLDTPKAQISRIGGTLTCSVNPSSSGWSYYFYREKNQEVLTVQNTDFHSNRDIRVSQGGVYRCRGGRGEPVYYTEFSDPVTIVDAVLTFEPKWSTFFIGEYLTFKCDMKEGRTDDWKYTLKKSDWTPYSDVTQQDFKINLLDKSHSGDYQCCGLRKGSYYKKCSNRVSIRVSDRARATLTAATTTVSVGDKETLICSVEKSAGWKYEWFRRTSHTSEDTINDGLNGNIRVSQGGIYRCRGFRGEPAVYSDKSDEVTIQITFSNKVSVTQKPSWSQIFRGERITLTCEVQGGEGVQWEYEWRTPQSQTFRTKQKDWTITASISGDYSCKSRPTDDSYSATKWSKALRLSVLGKLIFCF
uniref:Ig-like domain-containing protein n=1 Tax=Oryzias latipes TaxID=8090 RepID=A0A3B3HRT2_ORYLA